MKKGLRLFKHFLCCTLSVCCCSLWRKGQPVAFWH
jgi:hypothetical protein